MGAYQLWNTIFADNDLQRGFFTASYAGLFGDKEVPKDDLPSAY